MIGFGLPGIQHSAVSCRKFSPRRLRLTARVCDDTAGVVCVGWWWEVREEREVGSWGAQASRTTYVLLNSGHVGRAVCIKFDSLTHYVLYLPFSGGEEKAGFGALSY